MRQELGMRASLVTDLRMAGADVKHLEEHYARLTRFAL